MKLPGYNERGVERLQGVDPGVYTQQAAAYQKLGGAVSGLALQAAEAVAAREGRQAIVDLSNDLTEFRTTWGEKRDFTEAELKEIGITITDKERYKEEVDSAGNKVKVRRETFNAEDYYPQALKKQWEAQAKLQARRLMGPGRREKFLAGQQQLINQNYEAEMARAATKRDARQKVQYEVDIQNARTAGNYALSRELLQQHPRLTPEEKQQEIIKDYQLEEQALLFRLRERDDVTVAEIDQQLERLESPAYGQDEGGDQFNSLEPAAREKEILLLKGKKASMLQDRKETQAKNKGAAMLRLQSMLDDPNVTREQVQREIGRLAVALDLSINEVQNLQEMANASGGKGRYDSRAFFSAKQRLLNDPNSRTDDLEVLRPIVGPKGMAELYEYRAQLTNRPEEIASDSQLLATQREVLGFTDQKVRDDEFAATAVARYERAYQEAVAAEAAKTGRAVPGPRRMELAKEAAAGWLTPGVMDNRKAVEVPGPDQRIGDIPDVKIKQAAAALRKTGVTNPSLQQVIDWLNEQQKAK